jgi:hypothetical protein
MNTYEITGEDGSTWRTNAYGPRDALAAFYASYPDDDWPDVVKVERIALGVSD